MVQSLLERRPARVELGWLAWLVFGALATVGAAQTYDIDRVTLDAIAFDLPVNLEILPLESESATRDALAAGLEAINRVEQLTDPAADSGRRLRGVAFLNRRAGKEVRIDPELYGLLGRALAFCTWSQGAHGPVGGGLYRAWGLREEVSALPAPGTLVEEVERAACDRLELRSNDHATLAAGSQIDLWGFAEGHAVDQAVAAMKAAGASEGWVEIGSITAAFGAGPEDRGWPVIAQPIANRPEEAERIYLDDFALAMASDKDGSLEIAGDRWPPFLDQRSGRPVTGKVAVMAATERAVDAQALAVALFVQSPREGEFRLGTLRPKPAVLWQLGSGEGKPLVTSSGWGALDKW